MSSIPIPQPPVAPRRPQPRTLHGTELVDPYAWLADRDSPEVLTHLRAENAYTEAAMAQTEGLQGEIYEELVSRLQEDDASVPARRGENWYYRRTEKGRQYPIYCRRRKREDAPEEVLLDLNQVGEEAGGGYLRLGTFRVSPDQNLLAYSLDLQGSERYLLRIKDLRTGEHLGEEIPDTAGTCVWAEDGETLFYATRDAAQRPHRAWRHRLGQDPAEDQLVFEESDERFFLSLFKTRSRAVLGIHLASHTTTEVHYLDASRPEDPFRLLMPRRQGVEMALNHHGEHLYLLTNAGARNFRLLRAPLASPPGEVDGWGEVLAHREDVKLDGVDLFRDHLVEYHRSHGLPGLRIHCLATGEVHGVAMDEPVYTVGGQDNLEFETSVLRFVYSSPVTPPTTYDYDMGTRRRRQRKRVAVGGGYDPDRYVCERRYATAADGTRVPLSVVYRRGRVGTPGPALLYGYGAYGTSIEARWNANRLSLLDRGFLFAIAHVRGGGEMGRGWYEGGKLEHKTHTFGDFEAAAQALIDAGDTTPRQLAIRGGSAGGLLIGAVINRRPELFHAAIADVPFVDVVNTMLDPSIPLTVIEYEEWGNPADPEVFRRLRSYSPYDNVGPRTYPHLLVTAGLHDPRVQYWEPAKWVARLRHRKPEDDRRVLMKIDLAGGHSGASGRYDALRQEAFKLAFLVDAVAADATS
ncbi:MAG: S9 family peptidase [Acidobacteriota bacterium]